MTFLYVQAALARKIANLNRKLLLPRSTLVLASLTSAVAAVAALVASFVPAIADGLRSGQYVDAVVLLGMVLVVTIISTVSMTILSERLIAALIDWGD
jgi:O-antigen/teichoic acid export membrane protein